jgi:hypothetical protein
MSPQLHDFARRLAENTEGVCRYYLSNGRRVGNYWIVGDVRNSPGRSLFVRLNGYRCGKGTPGKWTDYVERRVMLRPGAWRLFCEGAGVPAQHNLASGRVA